MRLSGLLERNEVLAVPNAPGMAFPLCLALDWLATDGAGQLARVGVVGVGVFYPSCCALLAQQGAGVGHDLVYRGFCSALIVEGMSFAGGSRYLEKRPRTPLLTICGRAVVRPWRVTMLSRDTQGF